MNRKQITALVGAMLIAVATPVAAVAASSSARVTVQIKTGRTLHSSVVTGERGWITKGGTPRGKCSGASAAGALDRATHGRWTGKYYASVGGIFVTSVLGVKPRGNAYWSLYVNGKSSSLGICQVKLRRGEKLLFKIIR